MEPAATFDNWSAIVDYVPRPLGGRQPIAEHTGSCAVCRDDLTRFLAG